MTLRIKKGPAIAAALVLVGIGLLILRGSRSVPVEPVILKARDAVETVLATGRIIGEKTIPLSFVRAGRVAVEAIRDGDQVREGQILLQQENAHQETILSQKRAALATAKLNL